MVNRGSSRKETCDHNMYSKYVHMYVGVIGETTHSRTYVCSDNVLCVLEGITEMLP